MTSTSLNNFVWTQLFLLASSNKYLYFVRFSCVFKGNILLAEFLYSAVSSPHDYSRRSSRSFLADMSNQTPTVLLWEAPSHSAINPRRPSVHTYISTTTYSHVNCSKVERTNLFILRHGSTTTEPAFSCSRARSYNHRAIAHQCRLLPQWRSGQMSGGSASHANEPGLEFYAAEYKFIF